MKHLTPLSKEIVTFLKKPIKEEESGDEDLCKTLHYTPVWAKQLFLF